MMHLGPDLSHPSASLASAHPPEEERAFLQQRLMFLFKTLFLLAAGFYSITSVTLPLVKPALAVAVIFRVLDTLRMYDLPAILTGGANGTTTSSILVVKQLTSGVNSASALSTITFILIFAIALALVRLFNANIVGAQTGGKVK